MSMYLAINMPNAWSIMIHSHERLHRLLQVLDVELGAGRVGQLGIPGIPGLHRCVMQHLFFNECRSQFLCLGYFHVFC